MEVEEQLLAKARRELFEHRLVVEAVLAAQHKEEFMKGLQAALAQPTADRHRLLMQALRGVFRAAKPA